MKQTKPIYIIFGASAIISVVVLLLSFFTHFFIVSLPLWLPFLLSVVIGVISFFVIDYFVRNFIRNRLKMLYRSIRKSEDLDKDTNVSITEDAIQKAEEEAKLWTEERNKEISKLKEQEAFRREFLGNLAHELKTPVFSIQGYILTLLEGGLEDEGVNRLFLERAEKATDRIASILEDLDQITKLEVEGGMKMHLRPIDIVELTKEVFHELEMLSKEKNIKLKLEKDYSQIIVNADRVKIGQVLTNLIKNSINYGIDDGYTLVRFFAFDDIVTIEVEDNGPGIAEKDIPRLFERFYRVEKSRNRNEGGSGLGLAIVRNIIEAHKQTISVRSTVGKGSTFSFSLDKVKSGGELFSSRGIPIK